MGGGGPFRSRSDQNTIALTLSYINLVCTLIIHSASVRSEILSLINVQIKVFRDGQGNIIVSFSQDCRGQVVGQIYIDKIMNIDYHNNLHFCFRYFYCDII